jgi:hypothetical protein
MPEKRWAARSPWHETSNIRSHNEVFGVNPQSNQ